MEELGDSIWENNRLKICPIIIISKPFPANSSIKSQKVWIIKINKHIPNTLISLIR